LQSLQTFQLQLVQIKPFDSNNEIEREKIIDQQRRLQLEIQELSAHFYRVALPPIMCVANKQAAPRRRADRGKLQNVTRRKIAPINDVILNK